MIETSADITIRRIESADDDALERLAQLDTATIPSGAMLGAITSAGTLVAVVSLETGDVIADPFLPSDAAARLLTVRAAQLAGKAENGRRRFGRSRSRAALA